VISNRADAAGLALAAQEGVPAVTIESKPFGKDRAAFEAVLQSTLDAHRVELICLAGFMRLFTAEFVEAWYGKMLNIHPSLLPSFPGLDPHAQALKAGVKVSGATVHFVTPETDAGPVVMQGVVEVRDDDTPDTLSARILAIEHQIYPNALRLLASGKLRLDAAICRLNDKAGAVGTLISPQPASE
jgi:phosphoribosylglycinamide formyltransferase-1